MKTMNWKVIVETIGVFAIVASLIFVGLQMRQSQEIAIAETFLSITSGEIDLYEVTNRHAELWEKANGGAELSDAEALIFRNLVTSIDRLAHRSNRQLRRLGHTGASRDQTADLASFLYQNPAARKVWVSLWETRIRHRIAIGAFVSPFPQEVNAHLESLDSMGQ